MGERRRVQAEDGIRDATVTGVQTCALPIFPAFAEPLIRASTRSRACSIWRSNASTFHPTSLPFQNTTLPAISTSRTWRGFIIVTIVPGTLRSEERRVGKEWRYG